MPLRWQQYPQSSMETCNLMATAPEITLGDSRPYTVNLKINGEAFAIPSTTKRVRCRRRLWAPDKKTALTELRSRAAAPLGLIGSILRLWLNSHGRQRIRSPRLARRFWSVQVTFNASDESAADDWTWHIPTTRSAAGLSGGAVIKKQKLRPWLPATKGTCRISTAVRPEN